MKRLVAVRHGDCNSYNIGEDHLYDSWREIIAEQTEKIRHYVSDGSILVISSTALRAKETAGIIANGFGCEFEGNEAIGSYYYQEDEIPQALELICSVAERADNIILVTHSEYCEILPVLFSQQNLDVEFEIVRLRHGQAWIIDIKEKSIRIIE